MPYSKIAQLAKISPSTVQGYFQGKTKVRQATERKILDAWSQLIELKRAGMLEELEATKALETKVTGIRERIEKSLELFELEVENLPQVA